MCVDTVSSPRRSDSGFTLIEILVALIILSIGLLGLEALGIGAARTLAMSEKQTEFTSIAATAMEELRASVVNPPVPIANAVDSTSRLVATTGDTAVVTRVLAPIDDDHARLTVRVRPRSTRAGIVQAREVQLDSYMYHANLPTVP